MQAQIASGRSFDPVSPVAELNFVQICLHMASGDLSVLLRTGRVKKYMAALSGRRMASHLVFTRFSCLMSNLD